MEVKEKLKFLKLIIHSDVPPVGLTGLCGGYELKEWRYDQLANWLFDEHLLDFALKYSEFNLVDGRSAPKKLREAAKTVFQSENLKRGEFGELLLHGIIKEVFDTIPAISKIYFKDGPNETVKGFDAVHIVENGVNLELWLGEVKFYSDFKRAVYDVVPELEAHFKKDYLENEFAAIVNKLDRDFPYYDRLSRLLSSNTSLDDVFSCICAPVLLTYNSDIVARHRIFDSGYIDEMLRDIERNHQHFLSKLNCPVKVHLFLLPLENKEKLSQTFIEKLTAWQKI